MIVVLTVFFAGIIIPIIILADFGLSVAMLPTARPSSWSFNPVKNWYKKCMLVNIMYFLAVDAYFHAPMITEVWGSDLTKGRGIYFKFETLINQYIPWYISSGVCCIVLIIAICVLEFFSWKNFFKKLKGERS